MLLKDLMNEFYEIVCQNFNFLELVFLLKKLIKVPTSFCLVFCSTLGILEGQISILKLNAHVYLLSYLKVEQLGIELRCLMTQVSVVI